MLEAEIQASAKNKDRNFKLSRLYGKPFRFVGKQNGFKIYAVNGEWIRNNLGVRRGRLGFEHAGHGYVHEFIPLDEIWVDTHHFTGCQCHNVRADRKMSKKCFDSAVIHEITEFKLMELGIPWKKAHKIALWVEKTVGILKDPYTEEYTE